MGLKTANNISMACFEMINKLLMILKSIHSLLVLLVVLTQPTEDLQVLLSTTRMTLEEMIPNPRSTSDPTEVADLAFHPGECLQVVLMAREYNANLIDDFILIFQMFQPEMNVDIL